MNRRADEPEADPRAELRRELRRQLGPTAVIQAWLSTPSPDWAGRTPLEVIESGPDGPAVLLEYLRRYGA